MQGCAAGFTRRRIAHALHTMPEAAGSVTPRGPEGGTQEFSLDSHPRRMLCGWRKRLPPAIAGGASHLRSSQALLFGATEQAPLFRPTPLWHGEPVTFCRG
jgi:hypothetical protein